MPLFTPALVPSASPQAERPAPWARHRRRSQGTCPPSRESCPVGASPWLDSHRPRGRGSNPPRGARGGFPEETAPQQVGRAPEDSLTWRVRGQQDKENSGNALSRASWASTTWLRPLWPCGRVTRDASGKARRALPPEHRQHASTGGGSFLNVKGREARSPEARRSPPQAPGSPRTPGPAAPTASLADSFLLTCERLSTCLQSVKSEIPTTPTPLRERVHGLGRSF